MFSLCSKFTTRACQRQSSEQQTQQYHNGMAPIIIIMMKMKKKNICRVLQQLIHGNFMFCFIFFFISVLMFKASGSDISMKTGLMNFLYKIWFCIFPIKFLKLRSKFIEKQWKHLWMEIFKFISQIPVFTFLIFIKLHVFVFLKIKSKIWNDYIFLNQTLLNKKSKTPVKSFL